jgi:hypothetical protein
LAAGLTLHAAALHDALWLVALAAHVWGGAAVGRLDVAVSGTVGQAAWRATVAATKNEKTQQP